MVTPMLRCHRDPVGTQEQRNAAGSRSAVSPRHRRLAAQVRLALPFRYGHALSYLSVGQGVTNPEWQFLTDYRESWALKDRSLNDNREVPSSNGSGRRPVQFPELPILNASAVVSTSAPVRSQREKYGGLFYLGISGLVFLIAWIGWFGYGVWTNRDIWADVYTLSSTTRPEEERVQAAFRLSGNPRLDDTQKMALTLRRDLPDLARYLLAESVSTELVARDPRSFTMLVARVRAGPTGYGSSCRGGWDTPRDEGTISHASRSRS